MISRTFSRQSGGTLVGFVIGLAISAGIAVAITMYISKNSFPVEKLKSRPPTSSSSPSELPDLNRPLYGNLEPARAAARELAEQIKNRPAIAEQHGDGSAPEDGVEKIPGQADAADKPPADEKAAVADAKPADTQTQAAKPAPSGAAQSTTAPTTPADAEKRTQAVYYVQAGAYHLRTDAEGVRAHLAMAGVTSQVSEHQADNGSTTYRVRVGPIAGEEQVHEVVRQVTTAGMEASVIRAKK